jgi:hypothetical protein
MNDFEMVSGIHKVSMGRPPPGVTAGVAFLQLQEADDTDMGPFLAMLEESVAELAGSVLRIIKERYREERLIYTVGANRKYQVRAFNASELSGAVDVLPVAESSFPWSKTARQSMMLSLATTMPQLFTDAETGQFDTARFARLLPIGGLESFAQSEDIDTNEALNEEAEFREGDNMPQVGWWQNHQVHFNQHVRILKSSEFKDWEEQRQQAYLAHVQETMQARDAKAAEAAQMNAMAQGNAPKELYQQGGPGGGEMVPPPGEVPPEEMMAEMGVPPEMDPAMMEALMAQERPPAERGLEPNVSGIDEEGSLIV